MAAQLIVALDVPTPQQAESLVDQPYELDVIFKVGLEALYGYGDRIFAYLEKRDVRHFIDAKLHDIPRTVAAAARALVRPGTHILTIHAAGGNDMMLAAVEATQMRAAELGISVPHVFAVTVLTSIPPEDYNELGFQGGPAQIAMRLGVLARDAGCAGVVCSAQEVSDLKRFFGASFLTLTPGIRPSGAAHADQRRVTTPADAVRAGADYLVVGRPIVESDDPLASAKAVLEEMRSV